MFLRGHGVKQAPALWQPLWETGASNSPRPTWAEVWQEEGVAAVPVGSENKSWSPSPMLMFHLDPTAFPRIEGLEMMFSMPF